MSLIAEAAQIATHANDRELMDRVLVPYKPHCQYLKSARVSVADPAGAAPLVAAQCELAISESCYIDDTGHFNSVEFNICFNQMMYYVLAKAVKERLHPALAAWTMDDYWAKQLPDVLIVDFRSTFKRPVNAARFHGEIEFTELRRGTRNLYLRTHCRFRDDRGGHCEGSVDLVVVSAP